MKEANVIEFPKARTLKKRVQDKVQEQKSVAILSIASVLILTVFFNQMIGQGTQSSLSLSGSRNVASLEPAQLSKDIKWEQEMAKTIAAEKAAPVFAIGESPTLRDELIFGYLEGKYGMKLSQGRIESLEFIDAQAGEHPMEILDKADFLLRYSEAFGRNFKEVSLSKETPQEKVFNLISSSKEIVGSARFVIDGKGLVESIHFN